MCVGRRKCTAGSTLLTTFMDVVVVCVHSVVECCNSNIHNDVQHVACMLHLSSPSKTLESSHPPPKDQFAMAHEPNVEQ